MKRLVLAASLFFASFNVYSQKSTASSQLQRPKLVVGIVVDQMRWDYLYRYYDRYTNDGFKRLMNEGFNCQNTMINYLPSYTAPGHSCVYTGSVPAIHGIAGNDWVDNSTGKAWYCTDDTAVQSVGTTSKAGRMSPANLLATTVTDELRLATNKQSRVFGIALKDRGSILPAGHLANAAYWFDDANGQFISSTYYMQSLPAWVNNFNNRRLPDSFLKAGWQLLFPNNTYLQSTADSVPYENVGAWEHAAVFPRNTAAFAGKRYDVLRYMPAGNTITLKMAEACIDAEQLGKRGATDFLCVSFSTTDYIGHQYGPNAMEVEDAYLRLDHDLATFLQYLDARVGKGNYTIFLTADHGAAHNSQFLSDLHIPGGNNPLYSAKKDFNARLKATFGSDSLVLSLNNYQVSLNDAKINAANLDKKKISKWVCNYFAQNPAVAYVVDLEDANSLANIPEPIRTMVINGYNRQRSGSIQIIYKPGWYDGYAVGGTTHGTWNPYDTHIPLLWYGWHIPRGETHRTIYMTDIAATVAALLNIQMPNGCVGHVITEVVK